MVQFIRKVSDSEQLRRADFFTEEICSECDSFQLYQDADVQPICIWGLYSFSLEKKPFSKAGTQVFFCNYYHDLWAVFEKWAYFADLLSEAFKKDI